MDAQHIHASLPGFVQLMHECWAHFPNDRPSTDQCVEQLEQIQVYTLTPTRYRYTP